MASIELQKYVNDVGKYIKDNDGKIEYEAIDALHQAGQVAMFTEHDVDYSLRCYAKAKELLVKRVQQEAGKDLWEVENLCIDNGHSNPEIDLYYNILLDESYYNLQSYMYFMERKRPSAKRFYYPRRKTLRVVVNDLMALDSGKYKFYGLSMPSRTGKSTTCILFLTWVMMKRPNAHNAMGGHSGILAKGFYKETMNLLTTEEYCFKEIYKYWNPEATLIRDKSAEEFTVVLDKPDRFASLVCRGIDGTWTGAVDVSADGYLYVDDLIRDREHSLSPIRMENTYQEYLNKMVDRKNDGAKELMVGTLWNIYDPLERMRQQYEGIDGYMFRKIPALNDDDTSNFDYDINGFSSQYYIDMRSRLDKPEWEAKYQQRPFVREGLLFPLDELRYFDGLLPEDERRVVAVCDPAFGGGDSLSMPICADFGDKRKYIVDWIFNKGTQKITVPLIVDKILKYGVTELQIEKNNGGMLLADSVKKEMEARGCIHCKINLVSAPVKMSKEDKITGYSDFVKDNFIFLMPNKGIEEDNAVRLKRNKEYQDALDELSMYSPQGKNPHDDAPDALVQLAMFFEKKRNGEIEVVKNPFRGMM